MLGLTLEANGPFVAVVGLCVAALVFVVLRGATSIRSRLFSIEAGVGRIDQAVNCTPPSKPAIKENAETAAVLSKATLDRLDKVESDVAAAGAHALEARLLSARALSKVTDLGDQLHAIDTKLSKLTEDR